MAGSIQSIFTMRGNKQGSGFLSVARPKHSISVGFIFKIDWFGKEDITLLYFMLSLFFSILGNLIVIYNKKSYLSIPPLLVLCISLNMILEADEFMMLN